MRKLQRKADGGMRFLSACSAFETGGRSQSLIFVKDKGPVYIIFPRSTNPKHIKENIEIFDFNLSDEEMEEIRKLDRKTQYVNW